MSRKTVGDTRRRVIVGSALLSTAALVAGGLAAQATPTTPVISHVYSAVGTDAAVGPLSGGSQAVHILGSNLDKVTSVWFGSQESTHFTLESATEMYATPPAAATTRIRRVDVAFNVVGDDDANDLGTVNDYTYTAGPVLTTVATATDGKTVKVTGSQLLGATAVLFGDTLVKVDKKTPATATEVSVKTPALKGGSYDVSVVAPSGIGTKTAAWGALPTVGKLYLASEYGAKTAKTVSRASAATGTVAVVSSSASATATSDTGTVVILTGTGFTGLKNLRFGKADANFVVLSDTAVRAIVPPMSTGDSLDAKTLVTASVLITAVNAANPLSVPTKGLKFQYDALPTITSLSDIVGAAGAATNTVTIVGTHLDKAKVKVGRATVKVTETTATKLVLTIGKGTADATESIVLTTVAGTVTSPVKYTWKATDALTAYPAS